MLSPKWISLILLVLQTTLTIIITRYSRTESKHGVRYLSSTAVVFSEVLKVLICLAVIFYEHAYSWRSFVKALHCEIWLAPKEMGKILIPAVLYTVQNNLIFLALSNLNAATYQVTYQLKLFTTAFFSIVMLNTKLSAQKWLALLLLMFGVIMVQFKGQDPHKHSVGNPVIGLTAVLSACLCSGFSGVYFEKLLKQSTTSLWMRNVQLGIWGVIIGIIASLAYDYVDIVKGGFTQGYDIWTIQVILLQALGGLIIATVIKYADNIVKGFANAISISLSAILSHYILHDFQPSLLFATGTLVVIASTVLYGYNPKASAPTKKPDTYVT